MKTKCAVRCDQCQVTTMEFLSSKLFISIHEGLDKWVCLKCKEKNNEI